MTPVILFVWGAIAGSFLNVAGLRLNSGLTLRGRSACFSCGKRLSLLELVPILSFFALRGRCAKCRSRISWQYPLVEMWTGLLFLSLPGALLPAFALYVVIVIYDARHKIIPDTLVYLSAFYGLGLALFEGRGTADLLSGPILFALFALVWLASRGRAMGFGDAKLVLSIGLLLGAAQGFSAIILAFWLGAAYGLTLIVLSRLSPLLRTDKRLTMKSEIPFAPFLVLGAWLSAAFTLDLLHVASL